jgi:hypothetical protein
VNRGVRGPSKPLDQHRQQGELTHTGRVTRTKR